MPDVGDFASQFRAGRKLVASQLDVVNDRVPYFAARADGNYLPVVISPADLWGALGPAIPPNAVTLDNGTPVVDDANNYVTLG